MNRDSLDSVEPCWIWELSFLDSGFKGLPWLNARAQRSGFAPRVTLDLWLSVVGKPLSLQKAPRAPAGIRQHMPRPQRFQPHPEADLQRRLRPPRSLEQSSDRLKQTRTSRRLKRSKKTKSQSTPDATLPANTSGPSADVLDNALRASGFVAGTALYYFRNRLQRSMLAKGMQLRQERERERERGSFSSPSLARNSSSS